MQWALATAKNGERTLSLNNVQLYSRYRPREDAWKWTDAEFDDTKSSYLLIGLGLGYHAERLIVLAQKKPVYVYYFDEKEYELAPIPHAVSEIKSLNLYDCQILIPNAWVKALVDHPLLPYLEDIKIKQRSFKKFSSAMEHNFAENKKYFQTVDYPAKENSVAYLVASGPSLNETIKWVAENKKKADVYVVGSALKMLLKYNIEPKAVIISDAQSDVIHQLANSNYNGSLYFLSTANEQAVTIHQGEKFPLFQQGYEAAESIALELGMPIIETGGSVSTTAISLLECLGYEKIVLFGQDMGFSGKYTHASLSTSGRIVKEDLNVRKTMANNGMDIWTTPNLQVYARWIEQKVQRMRIPILTTSENGLAIQGVHLITKQQLDNL